MKLWKILLKRSALTSTKVFVIKNKQIVILKQFSLLFNIGSDKVSTN